MDAQFQPSTLLIAWALGLYALFLQGTVVRCVRANDRDAGLGWWLGGALCVGTGFWAQSLLNLVALQLPIRVGFVAQVVLAAWMPAVVISAAAIWMQTRLHFPVRLRVIGGVLIAFGFCLLTFIHASAIMFQPSVSWDVWRLMAASLLTLGGLPAGLAGLAAESGGRATAVGAVLEGAGHQWAVQRGSGVHGVGHAGARGGRVPERGPPVG